jgi:hypothetical protein
VAIGFQAGLNSQSPYTLATGYEAGHTSQGTKSVAIGYEAGNSNQGDYAVAIGHQAGHSNQADNSIVINATNGILNGTTTSACYIAPIRNAGLTFNTFTSSTAGNLTYNATLSEISYNATSYRCSVIAAASGLALNPTLLGSTYIVTGSGTLAITNTLAAGDAGFFVYLKNGNNSTTDITLSGLAGATTLHGNRPTTNTQIVILFWNGTTLTGY